MSVEKDPERENRIEDDIIVDANGTDEVISGWYYYLLDNIDFPIKAKCITERSGSPLKLNEVVEITNIADFDDCMAEMFVLIKLMDRQFGVPLMQLQPIDVDDAVTQRVEDWHYWVGRGYTF